jgi:hypothetical protein
MALNPFTRRAQRKVVEAGEQAFEEAGWGTHLTFPTQRRDGQKLYFQMRLLNGLEMIDVSELAEAATGAPAFVGQFATAMKQAREQAGVIVVGGVRAISDPQHDVLFTLTVALTELDGPFNVEDFLPEDSPSTLHSKQDYEQISEHVYRIHRISVESPGEGQEPLPTLMIEFLFLNRYGVLAGAFTTQREDMMGDKVRNLFFNISQSFFIGEKPAAV